MQSYFEELKIKTSQPFHVCDITDSVRKAVDSSGISEGIATLTSMHTTCALTVNENEERLFSDIENYFLGMALSSTSRSVCTSKSSGIVGSDSEECALAEMPHVRTAN